MMDGWLIIINRGYYYFFVCLWNLCCCYLLIFIDVLFIQRNELFFKVTLLDSILQFKEYFGDLLIIFIWVRILDTALPLVDQDVAIQQPATLDVLTNNYADRATQFIANASASQTPFFLYMAFSHVHIPNFVNPAFCGKSGRGSYGDALLEIFNEVLTWLGFTGLQLR